MENNTKRKELGNIEKQSAPDEMYAATLMSAEKETNNTAEDRAWDEWVEFGKKTGRILKVNASDYLPITVLIFLSVLFFAFSARAWTLGGNYDRSDTNFDILAMRVYNSGSPYTLTRGAYTYNALPITTSASGCKIVSVIRRTQGFPNPKLWNVENYEICNGNITEVKNTNPAGWNNLPQGIKPVINNAVQEARQFGKAKADYYGYRVVAKTGAYVGTVFVYVLNGIKLESAMRF